MLPTRVQIEAPLALPKYKVDLRYGGTWYAVNNANIVAVSGDIKSSGNTMNGLAFGTHVESSASIRFVRKSTPTGLAYAWEDDRLLYSLIRISYGFSTSAFVPVFIGVISEIQVDSVTTSYTLSGVIEYIRNTKVYTDAVYNRPIATRTTIASVEDPTHPNYQGGTINLIFWYAGGRPAAQRGINYTDSDAKFWYECDQSLFSPQWTWLNGENLVDELFMLARASGGQIYESVYNQDGGIGVIRYIQPLTFADSSGYVTYFNYTASHYGSFSKDVSGGETVATVRCKFVQRRQYVMQKIYEDSTPHLLRTAEVRQFDLDTQLPIYEWGTINSSNVKATVNYNQRTVNLPVSVIRRTASRVTISVTNNTGSPVTIHKIELNGAPLAVEEEGIVTVGTGDPQFNVEDNPYIQSYSHANRITQMIYDFYNEARPIITLSDCIYDPDRFVGEIVRCNNPDNVSYNGTSWVQTTELYRIINISHKDTGIRMDVQMVPIGDLPDRNDMFIVDEIYISTDVRQVSY